jgi:hypothetical protein
MIVSLLLHLGLQRSVEAAAGALLNVSWTFTRVKWTIYLSVSSYTVGELREHPR